MPAGNPFKPKPAGYQYPGDPVGQLTEKLGKLIGSVENLFHGFRHLAESVKQMDRLATRVAFLSAVAAGPRSPIPYDLRDIARDATRRGSGSGSAGTGIHRAGQGIGYGGSPGAPQFQTGPVVPLTSHRKIGGEWVRVGPGGVPYGPGNFSRPKGGIGGWSGWNRPPHHYIPSGGPPAHHVVPWASGPPGSPPPRPNFAGMATTGLMGSSIVSAAMLKSSSPVATDTLTKSFELALAKFGHGTHGPVAFASRKLQGAANWADRNPELAGLIGKTAAVTVGLTGLAVVVNLMASAARNAAASLQWLATAGRGSAAAQAAGGVGGAAVGGAAAGGVASAGTSAGTGAAAGAGMSRRAVAARLLGRAAIVAQLGISSYDAYEGYKTGGSKGAAKGFAGDGLLPWALSQLFGTGKSTDGSDDSFMAAYPSKVQPTFVGLDEIHKQATLSALEEPLDATKNQAQRANDQQFIADAFSKGMDQSKVGQKIMGEGPAIRP